MHCRGSIAKGKSPVADPNTCVQVNTEQLDQEVFSPKSKNTRRNDTQIFLLQWDLCPSHQHTVADLFFRHTRTIHQPHTMRRLREGQAS